VRKTDSTCIGITKRQALGRNLMEVTGENHKGDRDLGGPGGGKQAVIKDWGEIKKEAEPLRYVSNLKAALVQRGGVLEDVAQQTHGPG